MRSNVAALCLVTSTVLFGCQEKPPSKPLGSSAVTTPAPTSQAAPTTPPPAVTPPPAAPKPFDPKAALHEIYGGDATKDAASWKLPPDNNAPNAPVESKVELSKTFRVKDQERAALLAVGKEGDSYYCGGGLYALQDGAWKPLYQKQLFAELLNMEGDSVAEWVELGPGHLAVALKDSSGGTGGTSAHVTFYEFGDNDFRKVFSLLTASESYDPDDLREASYKLVPGPNAEYQDIQVSQEINGKASTLLFRHNGAAYAEVK